MVGLAAFLSGESKVLVGLLLLGNCVGTSVEPELVDKRVVVDATVLDKVELERVLVVVDKRGTWSTALHDEETELC